MNRSILAAAVAASLVASTFNAGAADLFIPAQGARVVSSTPVYANVASTQQVCSDQMVAVQQPGGNVGGALVGGVLGAFLGNSLVHGSGQKTARVLAGVAGAAVGDNVGTQTAVVPQRSCQLQQNVTTQPAGFDVTYEFAGARGMARLPYGPNPGDYINVDVSVRPSAVQGVR
jgi:uncharacterized protein YcfJ